MAPPPSTFFLVFSLLIASNVVSSMPTLKKNPPSIQASISSFKESLSSVLNGNKINLKPISITTINVEEEVQKPKPEVVQVVEEIDVQEPELETQDTTSVDAEAGQVDMLVDENAMITGEIVVDFDKEEEDEKQSEEDEIKEEENNESEEETEEEDNEIEEETEEEEGGQDVEEDVKVEEEEEEEEEKEEEEDNVDKVDNDNHQIVISKATFVDALNKFLDTLLKAKIELHKASKGGLLKLSNSGSVLKQGVKETPRSLGSFRVEKSIRRHDATDRVIDEFSKKIQRRESGKNVIDATNILKQIQNIGKY